MQDACSSSLSRAHCQDHQYFVLTSVVGDVLALGVDPVELLVDRLRRVVPVLPDDALGLVQELVLMRLGW